MATGPTEDGRRWWLALAAVVLVGLAVRVAYVLVVLEPVLPGLDATWYQLQGGSIRHGTGYVHPPTLFEPARVATAAFPPAYPTYQALWQWPFGGTLTSVRLAGIVPASATITLAGVLGRRVLGAGWGLVVATVVALDPNVVAADGSVMSENLSLPVVLAVVLLTSRILESRRSWPVVYAVGLLGGVAVLNRPDLAVLVALVAAAIAWRARWWLGAVAVVLVALLVVTPWMFRNEQAVGELTVATLSPSSALAGSYCDATFDGGDLGSWSYACVEAAIPPGEPTEVEVARAQRDAAFDHLRDHLGRLPLVVLAREARVWSLWSPRDLAARDNAESRRFGWQLVARPAAAALAVVGTGGLVLLARRRRDDLLLLAPSIVVCFGAAVVHGNPRFASIAHPFLAIGGVWAFRELGRARRRRAPGEPT